VAQPVIEVNNVRDRRRRPRLRLACPVRLYRLDETSWIDTTTENISCEGFFCVTSRLFSPRETLECELLIPSEQFGQPDENEVVLHCRAEVVRIEPKADGKTYGIACRLMDYTLDLQIDSALPRSTSDS
jgi:ferredoxin-like protein FixX